MLAERMPPMIITDVVPGTGVGSEGFIARTYVCRGCGKARTFVGPTEKMVGLQIASAGWRVDGPRGECPSCWMLYEAGVLRAARGNS